SPPSDPSREARLIGIGPLRARPPPRSGRLCLPHAACAAIGHVRVAGRPTTRRSRAPPLRCGSSAPSVPPGSKSCPLQLIPHPPPPPFSFLLSLRPSR
ncbi:hypothetical protein B0H17DRAFT_1095363, partial [Mycena rosella]